MLFIINVIFIINFVRTYFRHVSYRFWFLSSSFSSIEPSKCVLQIVPPVLSLNSLAMLKLPPIIVFWLLVMWLVSD